MLTCCAQLGKPPPIVWSFPRFPPAEDNPPEFLGLEQLVSFQQKESNVSFFAEKHLLRV